MNHLERMARRKRIALAVHEGITIGEVAGLFGVSMSLVRNAFTEHYPDEQAALGPRRASSTIRIVAMLINSTYTLKDIADSVGVSYQNVQQIREQLIQEGVL